MQCYIPQVLMENPTYVKRDSNILLHVHIYAYIHRKHSISYSVAENKTIK